MTAVVRSDSTEIATTPEPAIRLSDVHKAFPIYRSKRDQLLALMFGHRWRDWEMFQALKGIDLTIVPGETVGLLGVNGAGKSTLLQVIAQTLTASSGHVAVRGKVAALLELGAGFNPAWTGRENATFHCRINLVPSAEIPDQVARIEAFADIGAYFDQPMRTYSSGMFMRVAFAAAIMVDPDILIVDEALAVGDARFQQKCFARFRALQEAGKTILFVTHAVELVPQYCTRAILLNQGEILFDGTPKDGVSNYTELLYGRERSAPETSVEDVESEASEDAAPESEAVLAATAEEELADLFQPAGQSEGLTARSYYNPSETRYGTGACEIFDVAVLDSAGETPVSFATGETLTVAVQIKAKRTVRNGAIGMTIKTVDGVWIYGSATEMQDLAPLQITAEGELIQCFQMKLNLANGHYFLDLSIYEPGPDGAVIHDVRHACIDLNVVAPLTFNGLANLDLKFGASLSRAAPAVD